MFTENLNFSLYNTFQPLGLENFFALLPISFRDIIREQFEITAYASNVVRTTD